MALFISALYVVGIGLLILGWFAKKISIQNEETSALWPQGNSRIENFLIDIYPKRMLIAAIGVCLLILGAFVNDQWDSPQRYEYEIFPTPTFITATVKPQ